MDLQQGTKLRACLLLKLESKLLVVNKISFGPAKFPVVFMLHYIGTKTCVFEINIRHITEKNFTRLSQE